jgi:ATP-dependent Lhr-like helicase
MSTFSRLHPVLQEILISGLGWNSLREVQEAALQAVSDGCDILVLAPTAGGKTEAAFLPVIDSILKNPTGHLSAVYISPLKALINDQTERVLSLVRRAGLEAAVQHGDVSDSDRWKFQSGEEPDILLTTPESLEVLLSSRDSRHAFSNLRFIIIDEIHAFIETSRGVHLRCLIDRLSFASENHITRIGLSATVGNPNELLSWMSASDRNQKLVSIPSPPSKKEFSFVVEPDFFTRIEAAADAVRGKKSLIFVESRSLAERLIEPLKGLLTNVFIHHSSVSPEDRKAAEASFDSGGETCVICTSTMELGIDIGDLDLVVQFGPPLSAASFLQRLGRTGRRDKPSRMVFILQNPCELLITSAAVESAMQHKSESLKPPKYPADVLAHQLLILLKGRMGLGKRQIISSLLALTPFSKIPTDTIEEILSYMEEQGYLSRSGDLYLLGEKAEAEFGKSNWKALISVIQDTGGYLAVLPDGTVIGTLDARFVAGDPGRVFTFTGKTWRLLHRDDVHRRALIEPSSASRGLKRPFWGGSGSSAGLSELICLGVSEIISRRRTLLPLPENEAEMLEDLILGLPDDITPGKLHIRTEPEVNGWSVVVSTFAGETVNRVIAYLLRQNLSGKHEFKITPFAVRIFGFESPDAGYDVSRALIEISSSPNSFEDLPTLPDNLWKFSVCLPADVKKEMAKAGYYQTDRVREILSGLDF